MRFYSLFSGAHAERATAHVSDETSGKPLKLAPFESADKPPFARRIGERVSCVGWQVFRVGYDVTRTCLEWIFRSIILVEVWCKQAMSRARSDVGQ